MSSDDVPQPVRRRAADCLFCSIVAGDIPAEVVGENEHALAFRDIDPKADLHALVIPKDHYPDVTALAAEDADGLANLVNLAAEVSIEEAHGQFRLIFNTGPQAGQSVFHVHGHVIADEQLGWSPA